MGDNEERELMKRLEDFSELLPKFSDGRIDYTDSPEAPVIAVFVKHKGKILLLKRSDKVIAYGGKWHAIGGFLDEIRPVREKVLEELKEELEIEEKSVLSINIGAHRKIADKNIGRTWIVYPVLAELKEEPEIKLDWEHTECKWIKPEELKDYDTTPQLGRIMESAIRAEEKSAQRNSTKVAIAGAGIIGTYLAWKLAKKGFEVSVFEQKGELGGKACSGLISKRLWHFFPEKKELAKNEIKFANAHFPKKDIEIIFSPHMLVLDRKGLEEYAARLAKDAGAKIFLGMKVANVLHVKGKKPQIVLEPHENGVAQKQGFWRSRKPEVSVPFGAAKKQSFLSGSGKKAFLEFDYVIGCDGANSAVRKALRLKEPKIRVGILCFGKSRKSHAKDAVEVFPSGSGFSWIIPRNGESEYGTLEKPACAKEEFLKFCRRQKIKPESAKAAPVPEGLALSSHDRIALCGDAAGLTKSWSGGGVIWGLTAAHMLARDFPDLKKYEKEMRRFFAPRMFFGRIETRAAGWLGFHAPFLLPKRIRIDSDWGV